MKATKLLIAWAVLLSASIALIGVARAEAQISRRLSATPKSFQTFYAKFKSAVLRGDKQAVASMTSFPFSYGWDAGDEGTYSRKQFLAKYNDIFRGTGKLFSKANRSFYVDGNSLGLLNEEDASVYTFKKKGGRYYLTSFVVEP
jgi:hypothetical protein